MPLLVFAFLRLLYSVCCFLSVHFTSQPLMEVNACTRNLHTNKDEHLYAYIDSGCTLHVTNYPSIGRLLRKISSSVQVADGRSAEIQAHGSIHLLTGNTQDSGHTMVLSDISYVPSFNKTLLSPAMLINDGYTLLLQSHKREQEITIPAGGSLLISPEGNIIPIEQYNNLFRFPMVPTSARYMHEANAFTRSQQRKSVSFAPDVSTIPSTASINSRHLPVATVPTGSSAPNTTSDTSSGISVLPAISKPKRPLLNQSTSISIADISIASSSNTTIPQIPTATVPLSLHPRKFAVHMQVYVSRRFYQIISADLPSSELTIPGTIEGFCKDQKHKYRYMVHIPLLKKRICIPEDMLSTLSITEETLPNSVVTTVISCRHCKLPNLSTNELCTLCHLSPTSVPHGMGYPKSIPDIVTAPNLPGLQSPIVATATAADLCSIDYDPATLPFDASSNDAVLDWSVIHQRMAHFRIPRDDMLTLTKTTNNFTVPHAHEVACNDCVICKLTRTDRHGQAPTSLVLGDLYHSDSGCIEPGHPGGYNCYFLFVEHTTSMVYTYFTESQDTEDLKKCIAQVERKAGKRMKELHSDCGSCYTSSEMDDFARARNIRQTFSTPYHKNENGRAERQTRTIKSAVRTLIHAAKAPYALWIYAFNYAVLAKNRSPITPLGKSPFELMYERSPDLSVLRVWGCTAYYLVHSDQHTLAPKARRGIMLGMASRGSDWAYTIGSISADGTLSVRNTCDVAFNEQEMFFNKVSLPTPLTSFEIISNDDISDNPDDHECSADATSLGDNDDPILSSTAVSEVNAAPVSDTHIPATIPSDFLADLEADDLSPCDFNCSECNYSSDNSMEFVLHVSEHPDLCEAYLQSPPPQFTFSSAVGCSPDVDSCVNYVTSVENGGCLDTDGDPKNWREASRLNNAEEWARSEDKEMDVLSRTFIEHTEAEVKAQGHQILESHFVYKTKEAVGEVGTTSHIPGKLKARLVAGGHQERAANIKATYAPTISNILFRLFISLYLYYSSIFNSWVLRSGDVSNAFARAPIPEHKVHTYIRPPISCTGYPRFRTPGIVWRITTALYGLKESPRIWSDYFKSILLGAGWTQSEWDPCLYYLKSNGKFVGYLIVYVDDILFTGHLKHWTALLEHINLHVPINDQGPPAKFLGVDIIYTTAGVFLSMKSYIIKMLSRFSFTNTTPTKATPMNPDIKLTPATADSVPNPATLLEYQQKIGTLLFLSQYRPDFSYTIGKLCKFLVNPTSAHLNAANRVIQYAKGTMNHCLFGKRNGSLSVEAHVDSDWGSDPNSRRSVSGFIVTIDGLVILHYSREQKSVSLSSMEAELFAMSQGIRSLGYLRSIMVELGIIKQDHKFLVMSDSSSAIEMCHNSSGRSPQKHIDIRLRWLQEKLGIQFSIGWISTVDNLADALTKALSIGPHAVFLTRILRILPGMNC